MQTESKENQNLNQKEKSKNESVKRLRCISDIRERFCDLSSVAAGLQSAMQQYYLPTIYVIRRRTGRSLAIVRSVSLRLQDEGQKNSRSITDAHGVFDTDFF